MLAVMLLINVGLPVTGTQAAVGTTLFCLEGTSKTYIDTTPASTDVLVGSAQFSSQRRPFGQLVLTTVPRPSCTAHTGSTRPTRTATWTTRTLATWTHWP